MNAVLKITFDPAAMFALRTLDEREQADVRASVERVAERLAGDPAQPEVTSLKAQDLYLLHVPPDLRIFFRRRPDEPQIHVVDIARQARLDQFRGNGD